MCHWATYALPPHTFFFLLQTVVNEGRLSANMVGQKCLSISNWTIWAVDGSKMSNSADNLVLLRYMQVVWLFLHIYRTHAQLPNWLFLINKKKLWNWLANFKTARHTKYILLTSVCYCRGEFSSSAFPLQEGWLRFPRCAKVIWTVKHELKHAADCRLTAEKWPTVDRLSMSRSWFRTSWDSLWKT